MLLKCRKNFIICLTLLLLFALSCGKDGGSSNSNNGISGENNDTTQNNKIDFISIENEFSSTGYWPSGLTWDGQYFFVSNQGSGIKKIFKYSKKTGQAVESIPSPSQWTKNLCFDGKDIWLTDYLNDGEKIIKISKNDGSIILSFPATLSSAAHQLGGGLAWDGKYLYYSEYVNNPNTGELGSKIYKINPNTGYILDIIYTTNKYCIDGLTYQNGGFWFLSSIYTGNDVINKIVNISMSGNELSTDTIPSNNLAGITSANGELWYITASGERGIHRFQPN